MSKKEQPEYITQSVMGLERHGRVVRVTNHFKSEGHTPSEILGIMKDWNAKYVQPPFDEDQLLLWIQYCLQQDSLKQVVEADAKSQKFIDVLRNEKIVLFHDQNEIPFAQVTTSKRKYNFELGSKDFQQFARRTLYVKTGKTIPEIQLKDCLTLLSYEALYEGSRHNLFHRVTGGESSIFYDLCNPDGNIIRIDQNDWYIENSVQHPFLFKKGHTLEQVMPVRGGNMTDFLPFLNFQTEDEKILFLCTLPVRLFRNVDQAIGYIYGPAGSGKTTLLKMTKELIDPSQGGISIPFKKPEDILPLLNGMWMFCNDNLSNISNELSDFFCTMATGGESSRRQLYHDKEIITFSVKNPAFITGINVEATNSDLLSRIIQFKTVSVDKGKRASQQELERQFKDLKPKLLGAIFETISKAIAIKPNLKVHTDFRMADFALWGAACAEAIGYGSERFLQALHNSMKFRAYDAIYNSNAGRVLIDYLKENRSFEGSGTELLNALKKFRNESDAYDDYERIANSPAGLTRKLRQLENSLLEIGVKIDFDTRRAEKRLLKLTTTDKFFPTNDDNDGDF